MKTDLEIDLKTARLEFRWAHPNLEQRVAVEGEGNLPDGYSISSNGKLIYTETSMGYEIELISVIF